MLSWIRTTRGVFLFVTGAGFLGVGAGLALWVEGYLLMGLVLIAFGVGVLFAVGYWVTPWGEPGWYRRTVRAWNDWGGGVKIGQGAAKRRAVEIAARVQALPTPPRLIAEAEPVVAQFQPDLSKPDQSQLDKRLRESASRLEGAAAGVARIEAEALSPEERAYALGLRKALDERLDATARMYDEAKVASRRLAISLAERNAPAGLRELRSQMVTAANDYAQAMETAHAAAVARDFHTLANLAFELGPAAAEMQRCRDGLLAASPMRRKALRASGG
jgi:hypothetical protein